MQQCNKIYQEFIKNGDGNYCEEWLVETRTTAQFLPIPTLPKEY